MEVKTSLNYFKLINLNEMLRRNHQRQLKLSTRTGCMIVSCFHLVVTRRKMLVDPSRAQIDAR